MNTEEKVTFLKKVKTRFGTKRKGFENMDEFRKFMNDCTNEQKDLCVKYMDQYSNKMFTGGSVK